MVHLKLTAIEDIRDLPTVLKSIAKDIEMGKRDGVFIDSMTGTIADYVIIPAEESDETYGALYTEAKERHLAQHGNLEGFEPPYPDQFPQDDADEATAGPG